MKQELRRQYDINTRNSIEELMQELSNKIIELSKEFTIEK